MKCVSNSVTKQKGILPPNVPPAKTTKFLAYQKIKFVAKHRLCMGKYTPPSKNFTFTSLPRILSPNLFVFSLLNNMILPPKYIINKHFFIPPPSHPPTPDLAFNKTQSYHRHY